MRSHGWSGNAPESDVEAVERILDAAERIIEDRGSSMRIADVARDLGVTRQTVYRYFSGTDALLVATAMRSANGFLDQLSARMASEGDPVSAMVEGLAFTIEQLGKDKQVALLLTNRRASSRSASVMSETPMAFGRALLHKLDIDWHSYGFGEADLDELSEFGLRTVYSFLIDPGEPPRQGIDLRRFLGRWVGPAIAYPRVRNAISSSYLQVEREQSNARRTAS